MTHYNLIDLTGDGHGHHVPGTPYVYKHGWKPIGAPVPKGKHIPKVTLVEGRGKHDSHAMGLEDTKTHRHIFNLANEARTEIYKANGLILHHPEVHEHELLDRIKFEKDPKIKAELTEDLRKRQKVLMLTLKAVERAQADAKRESARDFMARFDRHLRKIKGGKAIIRMRERLLSDKSLDRLGFFGSHGAKFAKNVGLRIATAAALGMVLGPIGGAVGFVGAEAGKELFHHVIENTLAESSLHQLMHEKVIDKLYERTVETMKHGSKKAVAVAAKKRKARLGAA